MFELNIELFLKTTLLAIGLLAIFNRIFKKERCSESEVTMAPIYSKPDKNMVIDRLKLYFQYFYSALEKTLQEYCTKLEDRVERVDLGSESVKETAGAIIETVVNPAMLIEHGAMAVFKTSVKLFSINKENAKLKQLVPVIIKSKIHNKNLRQIFAGACFEVFKSYELVFVNVAVKDDHMSAMKILAEEAVAVVIDYLAVTTPVQELTEDLILKAIQNLNHNNVNRFTKAMKQVYSDIKSTVGQDSMILNFCAHDLNATKMYSKVSLMDQATGALYNRKDILPNLQKYGYRLMFDSETPSEQFYNVENETFDKIKNYEFVLNKCNKVQVVQEIIDSLEKTIEDVVDEVRDVKELINSQQDRASGSRKKVVNVEKNVVVEGTWKLRQDDEGDREKELNVKQNQMNKLDMELNM